MQEFVRISAWIHTDSREFAGIHGDLYGFRGIYDDSWGFVRNREDLQMVMKNCIYSQDSEGFTRICRDP